MSAVNSTSNDPEMEAIRRAQRAHEPSMEEILASIRNIIAEERGPNRASPRKSSGRPTAAPPGPQIVYSNDPRTPEPAASEPGSSDASDPVESGLPRQHGPKSANSDVVERGPSPEEEPLLSPEATEAVTLAFHNLSATLAARSAEFAEGMVRDMVRPMLKAWLDENLPAMVERLVRAEIERIARPTR